MAVAPLPRPARHPKNVNLRLAGFEDYAPIASLAARYNLQFEAFEAWQHLWINNPAYQAVRNNWPTGWVLEDSKRDIVGYFGNIPLECEFRGQKLLTSTGRAWVVDAAYRAYAMLLLDSHLSDKSVELFLNPTLNSKASAAFTSANVRRVPVGEWDQSAFWITNYRGFAASALSAKGMRMANVLRVPLAACLRMRDFTKQRWHIEQDCHLERCSRFDERFDTFWEQLRKRNSHQLLSVRSRAALQWHFEYALREERAWVLASAEGDRINAYSIFYRNDNPAIGLKRIRLADYQSLEGSTAALLPMLDWALRRCRKERIDVLENIGFQPCGSTIVGDLAPYKRQLPNWIYYYKARSKALEEALSDPAVWSPSAFDGDASL